MGDNVFIGKRVLLLNSNNITIGSNSKIAEECIIETRLCDATGKYGEIAIGNGCQIGAYTHLTSINQIILGNNVLTGRYVLITDNSHGETSREEMEISPMKRKVVSKGAVVIDDNVWIGDKVSIMPGVHIGEGSIIAANAVVTKNIPPYSIAAGVPAKVIRIVNNN